MRKEEHWVFWQPMPSPHFAPFIRELLNRLEDGHIVTCVFERTLTRDRTDLGWEVPNYGNANVIICPSEEKLRKLTGEQGVQYLHFFSSLIASRWLRTIYQQLDKKGMFLGIITENRDGAGLKGALRWGHSWLVERPWRREIDVVFAMGQLGVDWLVSVGYPPEKVFPFGYVVDQAPLKPQVGLATEVISFVFVGRLDRGKNVALLLNSFLRKGFDKCRLIVVGDGPERSNLEQLVAKSKYGHVVQFTGVLKNSEVWDVLGKADCLVLPSRYDGWGAVINEALLSGARVIVSDRCGAATVVRDGYNGRVFRSGSVESLVEALKSVRAQGPIDATTRMDLIESASVIKEKALVTYFLEVVRHAQSGRKSMRPIAPWLF